MFATARDYRNWIRHL